MGIRATVDAVRIAHRVSNSVRHASVSAAPVEKKTRGQLRKEHGSSIYVYSHLQTKQVVYSLTPAIKVRRRFSTVQYSSRSLQHRIATAKDQELADPSQNNHALKQLPYNGKQTKPRAIRKDHWYPMAHIEFSPSVADSPQLGLSTFQKLREYRKLHETLWPEEEMKGLTRKERGRKLCNQRANTVADMAAALGKVLPAVETTKKEGEVVVGGRGSKQKESNALPLPQIMATVKWADILDAEFAEAWPKAVVHDTWETLRNNRKMPVYDAEHETRQEESSVADGNGKVVL